MSALEKAISLAFIPFCWKFENILFCCQTLAYNLPSYCLFEFTANNQGEREN